MSCKMIRLGYRALGPWSRWKHSISSATCLWLGKVVYYLHLQQSGQAVSAIASSLPRSKRYSHTWCTCWDGFCPGWTTLMETDCESWEGTKFRQYHTHGSRRCVTSCEQEKRSCSLKVSICALRWLHYLHTILSACATVAHKAVVIAWRKNILSEWPRQLTIAMEWEMMKATGEKRRSRLVGIEQAVIL